MLEAHIQALDYSGYTIVPNQLSEQELEDLRIVANNAVVDHRDAFASGVATREDINYAVLAGQRERKDEALPEGWWKDFNRSECTYMWGDAGYKLLDHDLIHDIASRAMPSHKLMDVMMNGSVRYKEEGRVWGWHRDHASWLYPDDTRHLFLWFFFLLDDFTAETGGTWVVPGTHRMRMNEKTHWDKHYKPAVDAYPSKVQALAKAGDVLIVNPNVLHSGGHNFTDRPRRTMNVRIGYRGADSYPPLVQHIQAIPEDVRDTLSDRTKTLLTTDDHPNIAQRYPIPVKRYFDGSVSAPREEPIGA